MRKPPLTLAWLISLPVTFLSSDVRTKLFLSFSSFTTLNRYSCTDRMSPCLPKVQSSLYLPYTWKIKLTTISRYKAVPFSDFRIYEGGIKQYKDNTGWSLEFEIY